MHSLAPIAAAALLVLSLGCDDKTSAPKAATTTAPTKSPASQPAANAASQPAAAGKTANPHEGFDKSPPGTPFTGLVKLAEGVTEADLKPTDVLFIMARESQGKGLAGRLVAVKRVGQSKYPLRYEISAKDVMVPGIPFKGPFIVMARLDRDGDPMSRGKDDLYATFTTPVMAGQEGVHLVLKKGAPKTMKAPPGVKAPMIAPKKGASSQPSSRPAK